AVDVVRAGTAVHEEGLAAAVAAGALAIDAAEASARSYDLVVDGVVGTGTRGAPALRGVVREVVAALLPAVREGRTRVVAVDLPSGLHPDDGTTADGLVLPADVTVTFGAVKAGLVRAEGPRLAGCVVLADIGIGAQLALVEPVGRASVSRVVIA
ncbi:MAG: NAD(P)H-hydrate epimerase, partial [Microbacterium sp.]